MMENKQQPSSSAASISATGTSTMQANLQSHTYPHQHQACYTHIPNNQYYHYYGWPGHYQDTRVGPPSQLT